jgi:tetratricopeptide (TPR) repeat protein
MREIALTDATARDALRMACATLDAAERDGRAIVLSQALAAVAHGYRALGCFASAESCLNKAVVYARASLATDLVADLLCDLCDTVICLSRQLDAGAAHAARERVRDHAFEAGSLACRVADADWEVKILLRVSDFLNRLGDHEDASQLQSRALRLMAGAPALNAAEMPGLGRLADA